MYVLFRIKIGQGAMVCKEIKVKGHVSFGASSIIHPGVTIIAEAGPIEIGENNIIEEYVNIIHKWVLSISFNFYLDKKCVTRQVNR